MWLARWKHWIVLIGLFKHISCNVAQVANYERFCEYASDVVLTKTTGALSLTPSIFAKSMQSMGFPTLLSTVLTKLDQKQCVKVMSVGGSICMGRFTSQQQNTSFIAFLVDYLNKFYPCTSADNGENKHSFYNGCMDGCGSGPIFDLLALARTNANYSDYTRAILSADLILVETSVNDAAIGDHVKKYFSQLDSHQSGAIMMEILLQVLLRLPNFPGIIYVGSSTKIQTYTRHESVKLAVWTDRLVVPRSFLSDVAYTQIQIARYYQIPYISSIDAIGPFDSPDKAKFFTKVYLHDSWHPSETGHHIIASLIMNYLMVQQPN